MLLRIRGHSLPGRSFDRYQHVSVGLERKKDLEQLVPADAAEATFVADIELIPDADSFDFRGPHVLGTRGDRFLRLTWVDHPDPGTFEMFRRAKLRLSTVDADVLASAAASGALQASLALSDSGGPICASIPSQAIHWTATNP